MRIKAELQFALKAFIYFRVEKQSSVMLQNVKQFLIPLGTTFS